MLLTYSLIFIAGLVIGGVVGFVYKWRNEAKVEKFTSTNTQRNANFLPRFAYEEDDPVAYNEAYSFHADCGDR